MQPTPNEGAPPPQPRRLSRQLGLAFTSIAFVALVMAGLLLSLLSEVSGFVHAMQRDEAAIRHSQSLSALVRDHAIAIARSELDPESHPRRQQYEALSAAVAAEVDAVAQHAPAQEGARIAELRTLLHEIDLHMQGPANRLERAKVEAASTRAAEHADALASAIESRMAHAHTLATGSTQQGLLIGGFGILVMLCLSALFTFGLQAGLSRPLARLDTAARAIARGDFQQRLGDIGRGELQTLAHAFDNMAEELAQREQRIIESERMAALGQLAAGVAHEINNPISIIRGYLKTMDPDADADVLVEVLAIIDEEASHCQRIAEDLLLAARQPPLRLENLAIAGFVEHQAERLRSTVLPAELELQVDVAPAQLQADAGRLRQLLDNLVLNARQALPANEHPPIRIEGSLKPDHYQLLVLDRGRGIAEEDRARAFEPFHSRRRGGSGLGLAVCQGIVRAHGGTIEIEARGGGGSTVRVVLPLERPQN